MKDISTHLLIKELKESSNVASYIARYESDLNAMDFTAYINHLLSDKALKKSQVIKDSALHRTYGYQVFSGIKNPSRDKVLMLAFGFKLNFDETQRLLSYAKFSPLYPKDKRDATITFCLMNHKTMDDTNHMLYDMHMDILE